MEADRVQRPEQASGVSVATRIVGNDARLRRDAGLGEQPIDTLAADQHTVGGIVNFNGILPPYMRCTRDMTSAILADRTEVNDAQVRVFEVRGEPLDRDQQLAARVRFRRAWHGR